MGKIMWWVMAVFGTLCAGAIAGLVVLCIVHRDRWLAVCEAIICLGVSVSVRDWLISNCPRTAGEQR